MRMKTIVTLAAVALGATAATTASAQTLPVMELHGHGIDCKAAYGQYWQQGVGEPGSGNFSNSAALRLFCATSRTEDYDNSYGPWQTTGAYLNYSDNTSTNPFSCYMWAVEIGRAHV